MTTIRSADELASISIDETLVDVNGVAWQRINSTTFRKIGDTANYSETDVIDVAPLETVHPEIPRKWKNVVVHSSSVTEPSVYKNARYDDSDPDENLFIYDLETHEKISTHSRGSWTHVDMTEDEESP